MIITGGKAQDHRGYVRFVNEFDMAKVKRFYVIKNSSTTIVRGWRAHRVEQRWFYPMSGAFLVHLVKIDNWSEPSSSLPVDRQVLTANKEQLLHVPAGYGTALQAIDKNSELLVFGDYEIEHASSDDYTWPIDFFVNCRPNFPIE